MKKSGYLVLAVSLLANIGLGVLLVSRFKAPLEIKEEVFRLVNPLGQAVSDKNDQAHEYVLHFNDLKPLLEEEIKKINAEDQNVGLFLQDLNTGAWLGINETEGFLPASLLKMQLLMSIFKKVERGEMTFEDGITLIPEDYNDSSGNLYQKAQERAMISVWGLVKEMILSSDNTAKNALLRQVSEAEINAVFAHVGIPNPLKENDKEVTPRGYSRIFKSLYFSTFLSPELSEKALDLATDTQEERLLPDGIPPEIQVAHKFGIRNGLLSDCGIVYTSQPYLLCLMTKNIEHEKAKALISSLSRVIFESVSSRLKTGE